MSFNNSNSSNSNAKFSNSDSVEELSPNDIIANQSSPRLRNKYLTRVGVEDHTDDDLDPLLN